ncbi:MAG: hypothetical protein RL708_1593 [Bacteroidota bacterium]|jgi:hypothetical protein
MEFYFEIFDSLNKAEVKYLLCGGLAINIFGIPRMTADIDLLVSYEENNLRNFNSVLSRLHFIPQIPVPIIQLAKKENRDELIKTKNLIAYSFFNANSKAAHIDVLVDVPIAFDELWNRKEIRTFQNTMIKIVSIDDLIKLKEYSNRLQDQHDILLLSKLKNNGK